MTQEKAIELLKNAKNCDIDKDDLIDLVLKEFGEAKEEVYVPSYDHDCSWIACNPDDIVVITSTEKFSVDEVHAKDRDGTIEGKFFTSRDIMGDVFTVGTFDIVISDGTKFEGCRLRSKNFYKESYSFNYKYEYEWEAMRASWNRVPTGQSGFVYVRELFWRNPQEPVNE